MHPKPLKDEVLNPGFLWVLWWEVSGLVLLVKVEIRRDEMVDLHRVDWMIEGILGLGIGSDGLVEIGGFLGFRHFRCSPMVELSEAIAMAD